MIISLFQIIDGLVLLPNMYAAEDQFKSTILQFINDDGAGISGFSTQSIHAPFVADLSCPATTICNSA